MRLCIGEREASLADGDGPAEEQTGDFIGRLRTALQSGVHSVEPFGVVDDQFIDAPVKVVEDRAVPGRTRSASRPRSSSSDFM